jgi:hypothetical protein
MTAVDGTRSTPRPRRREIAVQLNTRVSLASRDLVDDVAAREGLSIREVVEQALAAKWGSGGEAA